LERFHQIKNLERKGLRNLNIDIHFFDAEFDLLANVISVTTVTKVTVKKLCCQDMNLYSADVALKFILDQLDDRNHFLSMEFLNELIVRIKQRLYLNNSHDYETWGNDYSLFNQTSRYIMTKTIFRIIERLGNADTSAQWLADNSNEEIEIQEHLKQEKTVSFQYNDDNDVEPLSLKDKLNLKLKLK